MKLTLTYKFFLTMLAAVCVVVAGMFLLIQYTFDRGFLNYVNKVETERLESLAANLELEYANHGNWDFLRADFRGWNDLLRSTIPADSRPHRNNIPPARPRSQPQPRRAPDFQGPGQSRPHPPGNDAPPREFAHRVILMDENRTTLFGPKEYPGTMQTRTMHFKNKVAGYLVLIPQQHLVDDLQLNFVSEQKKKYAAIALIMSILAALLALPLTKQIVKRISNIAQATHNLAAGKYTTRLKSKSSDELDQLAHDFNSLAATLEQNEKLRREWMAEISHEFRTPLAVLRGEIEAMQDNIRPTSPEALQSLHSEVMRLQRLVEDIYQLSISDMGGMNYHKKDMDLILLLKEVLEPFLHESSARNISLNINLPDSIDSTVFGDPDRLHQLFDNLLTNSLKYTDDGGEIRFGVNLIKNGLQITIEDSKPGVDDKELEKIFNRFYRGQLSKSREPEGAGIGLAICRNIIDAHGGSITATPSRLGGILMSIELPTTGREMT